MTTKMIVTIKVTKETHAMLRELKERYSFSSYSALIESLIRQYKMSQELRQ